MYRINLSEYEQHSWQLAPLGHQLEDDTREVYYDITDWIREFGPGTGEVVYKRPDVEHPYIVEKCRIENNQIIWTLTETDTSVPGEGRCEVRFYPTDSHGETSDLIKSAVFRTYVLSSLAITGEPPQPEIDWYEIVRRVAAEKAEEVAEEVVDGKVDEAPEDGKQYARKDGDWEEVTAPSDVPTVTASDTEPDDPKDGDIWLDTSDDIVDLDIDDEPTEDSFNLVYSNGVYVWVKAQGYASETDLDELADDVTGIAEVIPSEATSLNKLADKEYVTTAIAEAIGEIESALSEV